MNKLFKGLMYAGMLMMLLMGTGYTRNNMICFLIGCGMAMIGLLGVKTNDVKR